MNTTKAPAARRHLSAAARRESILAAAQRLFSDKGFFGVPVDEIARAVGVSPAVLYKHFPSKEALYEAVLNAIACRREDYVAAVLEEPSDFASVLQRITLVYARSVAAEPDYLRLELHTMLEGSGAVVDFFEHRWRPFADFIEAGLREMAAAGSIPPVDEKAASLLFQGMLREALLTKLLHQVPRYREVALPALVEHLLELFFRAVGLVVRAEHR